jgi:RNA polymerase sigma-70 factor (ECF subfamily)
MKESEFEKLYFKYFPRLCSFAEKITKDSAASKNIVQEVFLKVYEKYDTFIIDSTWEAYLVKAVYNNSLLYKRKIAIHRKHSDSIRHEVIDNHSDAISLDDDDIARMQLAQKAVDSLPDQCKKVFLLAKKEGLSYARIALILGISVKTVDNHMSKAIKKIKEYVGNK